MDEPGTIQSTARRQIGQSSYRNQPAEREGFRDPAASLGQSLCGVATAACCFRDGVRDFDFARQRAEPHMTEQLRGLAALYSQYVWPEPGIAWR